MKSVLSNLNQNSARRATGAFQMVLLRSHATSAHPWTMQVTFRICRAESYPYWLKRFIDLHSLSWGITSLFEHGSPGSVLESTITEDYRANLHLGGWVLNKKKMIIPYSCSCNKQKWILAVVHHMTNALYDYFFLLF